MGWGLGIGDWGTETDRAWKSGIWGSATAHFYPDELHFGMGLGWV